MNLPESVQTATLCLASLPKKIERARAAVGRPLTLTEKILYAHLFDPHGGLKPYERGVDYADFRPDRVAMQDATAQMALLQLMNAGQEQSAVPATVHCDHLIRAHRGAAPDLATATEANREVYDFLKNASSRFGIGFWKPGAGIIHQVVLEHYAFPGGLMIGTDSHTPNAGGLGMLAVGVGGADAVDAMTGMEWELKMPKIIGVKLSGSLGGWAAPKDIILKLAGLLTVKGATNAVLEYFGEGAATLSATGKATVCNMGAEVGATSSVFPYDRAVHDYLAATGRKAVAEAADAVAEYLCADPGAAYDRVIEIDLSTLEPYVNGPFTPDAAAPLSEFADKVRTNGYPTRVEAVLIGSCTNSSYEDLARAASLARQALAKNIKATAPLLINPGSEQIRATAERDGLLGALEAMGAELMANACGPCIGQWKRETADPKCLNSIVTSFNRNFAGRADGNPNTHAFVASPETAMAFALAGDLTFNPMTDALQNAEGQWVRLDPPTGETLPPQGFSVDQTGYAAPTNDGVVQIDPNSERLQYLKPFAPWDGADWFGMPLLIKTKGKCTTDHISAAGPWLRFRGHLERISDNLLLGAVDAFDGTSGPVAERAKVYKNKGLRSVVVTEENYGEGSSREHAAMEPRFLNVGVVLAKSFARIHETNLKKQGVLALTFADPADYDKIQKEDKIDVIGLTELAEGKPLVVVLHHEDGSFEKIEARHTYNPTQIEWFRAGSALNRNAQNKK